MKNYITVSLWVLMTAISSNSQAFVTVGWTNDCDYNESITAGQIQAAINAGEAEIRVTNEQVFTEQVDIGGRSVIIKGAYNNCQDADNDLQSSNLTSMSGETFTQSAFSIYSLDNPIEITIDGFEVYHVTENSNGSLNGAGIEINDTTGTVSLKNMYLHHNTRTKGGFEVNNTNITSILNLNLTHVVSAYNDSFRGAGMKCHSNGLTYINVDGSSGFSFNHSDNLGGGMSLDNCHMTFTGGTLTPGESNLLGINGNIAGNSGGGIAAFNGAQVMLVGSQSVPFNISNNHANDGGAIHAAGFGNNLMTKVELTNSWLVNNEATDRYGGAVYLPFRGEVVFNPTDGCTWNDLCHLIENNLADDDGGAFYISEGGQVTANKVEITGSRAGISGTVAALRDDGSHLTINNSLIHKNGDTDHTEFIDSHAIKNLYGNTEISVNYSTFADNAVQYAIISPFHSDGMSLSGTFNIIGTVIADDLTALDYRVVPDNWTPTAVVSCVMFNEISTNPDTYQTYEQVIEGLPTFIDTANGNYRLDATDSIAIDRCDEVSNPVNVNTDVDGQTRPYDVSGVADDLGTLDIGYDEVSFDLIFKQSFE